MRVRLDRVVERVEPAESDVDSWCRRWLGAGVAAPLFTAGHLSYVAAVRLSDGREVVGKIRPEAPRLVACADPPWTAWDHAGRGLWPAPDDRDADLNAHPDWLDEVGLRVQRRLSALPATGLVVGHGDWGAQNLRWRDGRPWAVHDWDSVVSGPEAVLVGLAAAVWPCGIEPRPATVDESAAFIAAYQSVAGRMWTIDEEQAAWAAGVWVDAFNAKKAGLDGVAWLAQDEADERLRRAAA